ncbi:NTPase KAP family P-loop domain-containing protein 1 [Mastomys coucha]|uniref:NTPase KAP family P-loop domain-containing protein 1 n=1 Tax=Mastomys coucha TaxID=35658 RepID=UPI001261DD41|nr:NTPase KAP family P-loop domain-containing protein 1 [Mastomys coucha]XP_031241434.1 NTPase KAP family P-loop domain-containing protein 1 [Mastomys coucha]
MQKNYNVHFTKNARTPNERYFLDPELGHQKGCCRQWYQDPVATHTHGPYQLSPQAHWQQTYRSHRSGSGCRRCPQPLILQRPRQQQQRQPPPLPPSPLRQRHGPVRGAQKGSPPIAAARMGPASASQPVTSSPTAVSAMASSGPALPSAAGALLEPSEPTEARPLPAPAACGSFTSYGADILTEDDVYCSCLAKTLCHVPVPVTVGFYAPFGCRLHLMLDKIMTLMQQEAAQRESEELQRVQWQPRRVRGWGVPQLLWFLVFLQPVITDLHLRRRNVRFLFIRFSAWQYAGTDKLWAGLVTTLCDGIRHHYGALPFSVYSVLGNKPCGPRDGLCQREWHCRRRVCLALLALLAALCLGVGLLYLSLGGHAPGHGERGVLKALGGAATTLSGSGLLMAVYSVGKHLFVSQRKKIERLVSREKFGSQLGFMCEVKKEVELLTDFLCFLEIYQRRRLRVVLEVTGLDTCYPERVVGVLNAINTLLSDSHAPFIFILVVDPSILAACLESAGNMKGTADNGYLFLNRTVTLPFSVPVMGRRTKLQFLHDAVRSRDDLLFRELTIKLQPQSPGDLGAGEGTQLLAVETQADAERTQGRVDAEAARRIQEALCCLHDEGDCLYEYVPDNVVSMRRIVNTVPITVRLLQQQQQQQPDRVGPTPRHAVAWVVLANQWPCRLSWVLQCLEDRQQAGGAPEGRARLWDVFCDNSRELHTMTKALQNVLDLDGDPELFERFLGTDFPFTVAEAQSLLRCTVNLDHSIRRRMGLIRAVSALKPPSPPKSPSQDGPQASPRAIIAAGTSQACQGSGHSREAYQTRDRTHGGKPKPMA